MKLYLFLFITFAVTVLSLAQDENNFEDESAPAPPASSILARARGRAAPLKPQIASSPKENKNLKKATPASPPPPQEEEQAEDNFEGQEEGEYLEDVVEASSAKPTEAPKKIGQSARPFRSNQDLLESLKRRREQRVYVAPPSTTPSFTPVQQFQDKQFQDRAKAGRSKSPKNSFTPSQEQSFDSSSNKKSSNSRSSFNRNNKVTSQAPPQEEDLEATPAAVKPKFGGRGGRRQF